jgi:hypothetical protein
VWNDWKEWNWAEGICSEAIVEISISLGGVSNNKELIQTIVDWPVSSREPCSYRMYIWFSWDALLVEEV